LRAAVQVENSYIIIQNNITLTTSSNYKLEDVIDRANKVHNNQYEIIGYKGKQVRDQIHADDVVTAINEIIKNPNQGEVFNLGGGSKNAASIKELIEIISKKINKKPIISYKKNNRKGDHIVYITDFSKFSKHYPNWKLSKNLDNIIDEIINFEFDINKHNQ
jgi:CDP-paratose 2-epimerase